RRQILGAALAKPAAAQADILILGHREFPARPADVLPVGIQIRRESQRVPHFPALTLQQALIGLLVTAQGQLKRLTRLPGQIDELEELQVFTPVVDLPLELDLPVRLPPVADGGESVARA